MSKKRILPPDRLAECAAAHELFLAKKNQLKLSQKKVAEMAGITPAAVNLYFKGINPLNAQFASVLSQALGEPVERFSERLAKEIAQMAKAVSQPIRDVDEHKEPHPSARSAMDVASMLAGVTPRSQAIIRRIADLEAQGKLTAEDLRIIEQIIERFSTAN